MMVLIAGGDAKTRAQKRLSILRGPLEELDLRAMTLDELATLASTPTLLGDSREFFIRGAFTKGGEAKGDDLREGLLDLAEGLADSPHAFVFEEEKVPLKAVLERLKKAGVKMELLEAPKKQEAFNVFAMADALAKRDRKALWLLLMAALRQGIAPENVAGVLSWKARTMLASARGPERPMLEKISRDLVVMYHDSHRGAGDLGLLLERFALTI
jgi:hypothetical protein